MEKRRYIFILILLSAATVTVYASGTPEKIDFTPPRLSVCSPWYYVSADDIDLQASYCGYDTANKKRIAKLSIGKKSLKMIEKADKVVFASVFLFDVLYAEGPPRVGHCQGTYRSARKKTT